MSAGAQPQWTSPRHDAALSPAPPATTESADVDLAALAQPGVNVKQWIDSELARLRLATGADGDTACAERVTSLLYDRVQQHAHEVGNEVEELVTQTIVRLPRTTLELNRMCTDTADLARQLTAIETAVHPAAEEEDDNEDAVRLARRLNTLRQAESKLERCSTTLDRALRVDTTLRTIEAATQRLHGTQDGSVAGDGEAMDEIAAAVHEVRDDLAALREVEANYGERQHATLTRCERVIEGALERQCLSYLLLHHVEHAARLLRPLHTIGKAGAVLQGYARHAMESEVTRVERRLRGDDDDAALPHDNVRGTTAVQLRTDLIPGVGAALSAELAFLAALAAEVDRDATTVAMDAATVQQAMSTMITHVATAFEHGMGPLVQDDAVTNDILVDWYSAVRQLRLVSPGPAYHDMAATIRERAVDALSTVFAAPATLRRFCDRVVADVDAHVTHNLADVAGDIGSTTASDPYTALGHVMLARVKEMICYFPHDTLGPSVTGWYTSLQVLTAPVPSTTTASSALLRHLFLVTRRVKPGLVRCQKQLDAFLGSTPAEREDMSTSANRVLAGVVLHEQLWAPLFSAIESTAETTRGAIKKTMLQPLYAKTARYTALPLWRGEDNDKDSAVMTRPPAAYHPGHRAPSAPVREVGEAIIEIPLLLDTLRVESAAVVPHAAIPREEMNELVDEVAESWLETIVHEVMCDFVKEKVLRVRIDIVAADDDAVRRVNEALEQIDTDLNYLKNILSAVSEEGFPLLDEVLTALQALPPRTEASPFVLRDLLHLA